MAGLPLHTVALPALQNIDTDVFIQPNYDRFVAFGRAMKVFCRCYLNYQTLYPNIYNQMWTEYRNEMIDLFDIRSDQRLNTFDLNPTIAELGAEPLILNVGVSQMTQSKPQFIHKSKFRITFIKTNGSQADDFTLDHTTREQTRKYSSYSLTSAQISQALQNNWRFEIKYGEKNDPNPFNPYQYFDYVIPYYQIHAEGFQKWVQVGNTRILLFVNINSFEMNYNLQTINSFHLHTIFYAIHIRLKALRAVLNNDTHIHRPSNRRKISYDLPEIDPQSRDAFWGTRPDMTQNDNIQGPVKYMDLQIGYEFGKEQRGEKTCTCNEFCNLNAFFHYNPIYRFLLVQHNRLYMSRNRTTVANMYQLAFAHSLVLSHSPLIPTPLSTPVFNLLNSATEALKENHLTFHKKPVLYDNWEVNSPNGKDLEAITYMRMNLFTIIPTLEATYGRTPFDENAFKMISVCMEVIESLHRRILMYRGFVDNNRATRKLWTKEFEDRSRNKYYFYIQRCLGTILVDPNAIFEDRLFCIDFEQTKLALNQDEIAQVNRWKGLQHTDNPVNLLFETKSFTNAINKLWLALTKFAPMSAIYSSTALTSQYNFMKSFCDAIDTILKTPNFNLHLVRLKTSAIPPLFTQELPNIMESFRLFYKLKLYSRVYKIQSKFLDSLFRLNRRKTLIVQNSFKSFEIIWNNTWIEESPVNPLLPNLFLKTDVMPTLINNFYRVFWGRAAHDKTVMPQSHQEVRDSVYNEYAKRRFWDRIDGNNRQIFCNIITTFETTINGLIVKCRTILDTQIWPALNELRTYYFISDVRLTEDEKKYCIVLDELVHWLIRGTCYMITGAVADFLRSVYGLKNLALSRRHVEYFLSKPGLLQIFETINMVYRKLDELQTTYVVFGNPFDNITETFCETRYNVKNLYNNYFKQLIEEWEQEFRELFHSGMPNSVGASFIPIVRFHLISGSAFLISFVNHYRRGVQYTRKCMTKCRHMANLTLVRTHNPFRSTWDALLLWFENVDRNELGHPFNINRWEIFLNTGNQLTIMDSMDFSQMQAGAGPVVQTP